MKLLGFDFDGGRLDVSAHPFCGGVPEDVRLTTRYREDDFVQSLMGTIHETGHGRYEQNLPRAWLGQPVARGALDGDPREPEPVVRDAARRAAARSSALLAPLLAEHFGDQPAFEADNLLALLTRVAARPHPRRRRRGHLSGARDPALRDRARADRGRDRGRGHPRAVGREDAGAARASTRAATSRDGRMQDVHWTDGAVRLLPELHARRDVRGAVVRRDAPRARRTSTPRSRAAISRRLFDWLRANIWSRPAARRRPSCAGAPAAPAGSRTFPSAPRGEISRRVRRCE